MICRFVAGLIPALAALTCDPFASASASAARVPLLNLDVIRFEKPIAVVVALAADGAGSRTTYSPQRLEVEAQSRFRLASAELERLVAALQTPAFDHLTEAGGGRGGLERGDQFSLMTWLPGGSPRRLSGFVHQAEAPLQE